MDVVGQVLLARAQGRSHRTIGAELEIPADTVRGWIRRVTARAQWLRVQGTTTAHAFDSMLPATILARSALADAVSALGSAASAVVRRLGPVGSPWQIIAMIARGRVTGQVEVPGGGQVEVPTPCGCSGGGWVASSGLA